MAELFLRTQRGRADPVDMASISRSRATRSKTKGPTLKSRAVLRDVEPGSTVQCSLCDERVKFQAKMRHKQVICNVYVRGRWDRVEHFHAQCYEQAGEPYGEPDTSAPLRLRHQAAAARAS